MGNFRQALLIASALTLAAAPTVSTAKSRQPNFLVIVADDLGYSDLGSFGGEIRTPNLDALAREGVRLTNFYASPTCSPTRSMLLTGQDHHAVGLGTMEEVRAETPAVAKLPGHAGHLLPQATTVAERLSAAGYRTMMAFKWHLGLRPENGPRPNGFQQSYVLLQGGGDHYCNDQDDSFGGGKVSYTENGRPVRFPVGQFSGDYFTRKMLGFLHHKPDDNRPFFAYMAFTEPHWPLQAPPALIARYKGRYDAGPTALRAERLAGMKKLGLLDEHILGAKLDSLTDWNGLTPPQKAKASRAMEIYAAMVESLDINVGKLLSALRKSGELDNTIVVFLSDNGAEGMSEPQLMGLLA